MRKFIAFVCVVYLFVFVKASLDYEYYTNGQIDYRMMADHLSDTKELVYLTQSLLNDDEEIDYQRLTDEVFCSQPLAVSIINHTINNTLRKGKPSVYPSYDAFKCAIKNFNFRPIGDTVNMAWGKSHLKRLVQEAEK